MVNSAWECGKGPDYSRLLTFQYFSSKTEISRGRTFCASFRHQVCHFPAVQESSVEKTERNYYYKFKCSSSNRPRSLRGLKQVSTGGNPFQVKTLNCQKIAAVILTGHERSATSKASNKSQFVRFTS